jgi:hypothetical protein
MFDLNIAAIDAMAERYLGLPAALRRLPHGRQQHEGGYEKAGGQ